MFNHLVASVPTKSWSLSGTLLSMAFHAGVLYAAVHATLGASGAGASASADTIMVFVQPEAEQEPAPPPEVHLADLPGGFKTLVAPVSIPTDIPPVNVREVFDPRDYTGIGTEHAATDRLRDGAEIGPGGMYAEAVVDEKPEIISSPPLVYPDLLRQAGLEGSVLVEAIVDTSGRAEAGSVRVVQSSNPAFDQPAMDVVGKSVYRPGRMAGVVVRVLVNVPVNFSIKKHAE